MVALSVEPLSPCSTGLDSIAAIPSASAVRRTRCAEDQVFNCRRDEGIEAGIEALVAKYGKYRIGSEPREYRETATSFIHGFVIQVRPRTD